MILVCAATEFELAILPDTMANTERVVSGVGIPATFHFLTRPHLLPDLILNIGIAGAYPKTGIAIGDIVISESETYGDIGFELPGEERFRSIGESPFGNFYAPLPTVRPADWLIEAPMDSSYAVHVTRGCTVNTCTGTLATGILRRDLFKAGFETMEGAAVAQIGASWGVPVCEIRAISNIAADRDMRPENIKRALENLRHYLETSSRLQRYNTI